MHEPYSLNIAVRSMCMDIMHDELRNYDFAGPGRPYLHSVEQKQQFIEEFKKECLTFSSKGDFDFFRTVAKARLFYVSKEIASLKKELGRSHITSSRRLQRKLAAFSLEARNLHFALDNLVLKEEA